jgi:putative redox protein
MYSLGETMDVNIRRLNDDVLFEAGNANGNVIHMDGSPALGGRNAGFRPMELLLAGIGGCSAIDVVEILRDADQPLDDLNIKVSAERATNQTPAIFNTIHLHYVLTGKLDKNSVERALDVGITQQCSVGEMLGKSAEITYSYEIVTP